MFDLLLPGLGATEGGAFATRCCVIGVTFSGLSLEFSLLRRDSACMAMALANPDKSLPPEADGGAKDLLQNNRSNKVRLKVN